MGLPGNPPDSQNPWDLEPMVSRTRDAYVEEDASKTSTPVAPGASLRVILPFIAWLLNSDIPTG